MKIISRKHKKAAINKIIQLQILVNEEYQVSKNMEFLDKATEDLIEIAYIIGNVNAVTYISDKISSWHDLRDAKKGELK